MRFLGRPDEDIYRAGTQVLSQNDRLAADMRRKLLRASKSGSQMERWRNLIPAPKARVPEGVDV